MADSRGHQSLRLAPRGVGLLRAPTMVEPAGEIIASALETMGNIATLAFPRSGAYSFKTFVGSSDVHLVRQARFRTRIGGALPRRANGPRPGCPFILLDSGLALRPWQFLRQPGPSHLWQLSEL